ncbi:MAG TPA: hypothetical protein VKV25_00450 [Acidimicrobiales bacterium]|nr:hypothetical protein [Acidimicrobiales bacterium]
MAKPQQPELHRSGLTPADPASAKTGVATPPAPGGGPNRIPEANAPGHHPEEEQDKPVDRFEALAREKAAASRRRPPAAGDPFAPAGASAEVDEPSAGVTAEPWSPVPPGAGPFALGGIPLGALVPATSLLDAVRRPEAEWEAVGESRLAWMARIALLPVLGGWRYDRGVRRRLDEAGHRSEAVDAGAREGPWPT